MRTLLRKVREQALWRVTLVRSWYWGILFAHLGKKTTIAGRITVLTPRNLTMGKGCTVNEGVVINAYAPITIGDYVRISPGVIINSAGLEYEAAPELRPHVAAPVIIEDGVWIGSGAIVNPGAHIRKNSVIGSGAVVIGEIPENTVAVGVPAKVKKTIGLPA